MARCLILQVLLTLFVSLRYEAIADSPLKIVNGTAADDGEFPYMVQLLDAYGYFTCGGGIIGPEWILTAGHCAEDGMGAIVYGTNELADGSYLNNLYSGSPSNTTIRVKKSFQHPKFQYHPDDIPIYDIGILQLEKPIPYGDKAQPIKLAEANATIPFGAQGVLSGWGVNETWGQASKYLQKIYLNILEDEVCIKKINDFSGEESFNPLHNFCSDDYYNGECYGDSGSPYVVDGIQYGLVSWSYKPCGIVPGAYSRITNPEYREWIRNVTNI